MIALPLIVACGDDEEKGGIIDGNGKKIQDNKSSTTAYFPYQFLAHTLVLGNDIYDNSLDNEHKCQIWSSLSRVVDNGREGYIDNSFGLDASVDIVIDETLCDNLFFTDDGIPTTPVLPMPATYYKLASNALIYNHDIRGCVEVQFTDAFFNDPKSVENTYVIPLVMTGVKGIDKILTGKPYEGRTPSRTCIEDWEVRAMDYVLYCVKYMNPWQGKYIRRGIDKVTEKGETTKVVRKDTSLVNSDPEHYKENPVNQKDEICRITTKNMTQANFPVSFKTSGASISCNLVLTFNGNYCTISTDDEGVEAFGHGEFITKGTERPEYKDYQWESNKEHDILRLSYNVNFINNNIHVSTNDTLVVQTRETSLREFFSTIYVK
jgi:hypothetical protein